MEETCDPSNRFNKGVIVKEDLEKPCLYLGGCPYGVLVENFRVRMFDNEFTCDVYGHDCPSFYVSEKVCIYSNWFKPSKKRERLNDNLRDWPGWNDKTIIAHQIEKPCIKLSAHEFDWCPYGSLGDPFEKREITEKYQCEVFPHDCPIYYLGAGPGEDFPD